MAAVYGLNNSFPNVIKDGGHGVPKRTFKDKMTIGNGADRIELFYFGRAHTNGDAWVLFPSLRVMAAGDVFPNKGIPIMDKNAGGSGVEFPDTLTKAYNGVKDVDTIVTGHAQTTMTRDDLKTYGDFIKEFVRRGARREEGRQVGRRFRRELQGPGEVHRLPGRPGASVKNAATVIMEEAK